MAGTTKRVVRARTGRRRLRSLALRLALSGAVFVIATTSIARQDALGLAPDLAHGAHEGGFTLSVAAHGAIDLASLEAADLYASGRGSGFGIASLGGTGELVVLERPDAATETAEEPFFFVDRTIKGDLRQIRAAEPFALPEQIEAEGRPQPDALATLPPVGEGMRPDRRGVLAALPQAGDVERHRPVDAALVASSAPLADRGRASAAKAAEAAPQDAQSNAASAELSSTSEETAVTTVAMIPRESGANHDGSTPSVAFLNGGRPPATTTPAVAAPLAVVALPVSPHGLRAPYGETSGDAVRQVAFTPATAGVGGDEPMALRVALGDRIETRLSNRIFIPEAQLAKAQQCLAEAIYFEARGEPVEGQYAVAQVVVNRVRSGFYPDTICGVVYQNKHRRNACQFSFACDRIADRINNRYAWNVATRIAKDVTVGGAWLSEVGGSTHYHATYVRPRWIRDMVKLDKIGLHIFYRVRWHAPLDGAA